MSRSLCRIYLILLLLPQLLDISLTSSRFICCRFFLFLLINFLCHSVSVSQFRAIAAITRALVLANISAFLLVLMSFLFGGFIIAKREFPPSPGCCSWYCKAGNSWALGSPTCLVASSCSEVG